MKESAERLNSVIRGKAREHGWVYVSGIADEFRGRGYCMGDDSYFVSAEGSLVKQGDTKGTMHPNAIGQRVYGESIASALETHMIEGKPIASGDDGLSLRDAATRMNDHDDGRIDVRNLLERVSSEPPNSVRSLLQIM